MANETKDNRQQTEHRWKELANKSRREAEQLGPGADRDELLKKASQLDRACEVSSWISLPKSGSSR